MFRLSARTFGEVVVWDQSGEHGPLRRRGCPFFCHSEGGVEYTTLLHPPRPGSPLRRKGFFGFFLVMAGSHVEYGLPSTYLFDTHLHPYRIIPAHTSAPYDVNFVQIVLIRVTSYGGTTIHFPRRRRGDGSKIMGDMKKYALCCYKARPVRDNR